MSSKSSGKSPYQRSNASRRGRGKLLVITVVILLVATFAWIVTYTGAVATVPDPAATEALPPAGIDPGTQFPPIESSGANSEAN